MNLTLVLLASARMIECHAGVYTYGALSRPFLPLMIRKTTLSVYITASRIIHHSQVDRMHFHASNSIPLVMS